MQPLRIFAILFMLTSIGMLIYGIVSDTPLTAYAMPPLIIGIALGAKARRQTRK